MNGKSSDNIDKELYKHTLRLIKTMPILIAICDMMNTFFYIFNIDLGLLSYIGGCSFLTILLLYLLSYTFSYCAYHRMFIHYVVLNNTLSIIDYYNIIPIHKLIYLVLLGITLFFILHFHQNEVREKRRLSENSVT